VRLGRAVWSSVRALRDHQVRTALCLVGVGTGTAGVLLTSAVGAGAERQVRRSIEAVGSNLLVVRPSQVKRSAARPAVRGSVTSLRLDDYRAIAALPVVRDAAPGIDAGLRLKAGQRSLRTSVLGTTPDLARLRNLTLAGGRFFDEDDAHASRRVVVLGARVAQTLFPDGDGVGRDLGLGGLPFVVIGTLESRGIQADGSDQDGNAYIPIQTALRRVFNATWLTAVFLSVDDRQQMRAAEAAVRDLLRERHRLAPGTPDDFAVQDQVRLLALQQEAVQGLTLLTAGLAGTAMLVGGAGILALMFLSVKERTAEIGLRLAVGARPRDVLLQFLGEASLLAAGGWTCGAALAGLGAAALALGTEWALAFPLLAVSASFALALITGVGAGAVPARRASRLPPVRALTAPA
jgi:putative ABC transport system permease protein